MRKSALNKDALREIRKSRSRFISIAVLVALAVLFLFGLRMAAPDMKATADRYLDGQKLMDVRIASTLGITQEDVDTLAAYEGVEYAEGSYGVDAIATNGEVASATVHTLSISKDINIFYLVEGEMPSSADECVIEPILMAELGLSIGDTVALDTGTGSYEGALAYENYTIVGVCHSPLYISTSKGTSSLGSGTVAGIIGLLPGAYTLDYYTDLYLTVKGAAELTTYSDEYSDFIEGFTGTLDELAEDRAALRLEQVKSEAQEEIDDGWAEYADAEEEARQELADGWAELADARQELDDGWQSYYDGLEEITTAQKEADSAETELADALISLEDGEASYESALAEYNDGLAEYQSGYADAQAGEAAYSDGLAQYQAGLVAYESGYTQYQAALKEYQAGETAYADGLVQYQAGLAGYESGYAQYLAGQEAYQAGLQELEQLKQLIMLVQAEPDNTAYVQALTAVLISLGVDAPTDEAQLETVAVLTAEALEQQLESAKSTLDATAAQLSAAKATLDESREQLEASRAELDTARSVLEATDAELGAAKATLDESREQLETSRAELDAAKSVLEAGRAKLDAAQVGLTAARQELDDGWRSYNDGLEALEDARAGLADAELELADALTELNEGETEYANGLEEYENGKTEVEQELADAEAELLDAQAELDNIDECQWYVLDRTSNTGFVSFRQDAERMSKLALVFPMLFFLVAALVCLTTMTRMVEEQRVQIGGLKALGYSRRAITKKYVGYGLAASLLGSAVGLIVGGTVIPAILLWAWSVMYDIPGRVFMVDIPTMLLSVGLAILSCVVAVLAAVLNTLRAAPAALMRPRTPKAGKRVWLEYVTPLWKRMNFSAKVTARNLFRYKKRFWMTVIGIGGCTALLVTGFGLRDSINDILDKQYGEVSLYNAMAALSGVPDDEMISNLDGLDEIASWQEGYLSSVDFASPSYSVSGYLMSVPDTTSLEGFIDFHTRKGGEKVPLTDGGVVVTEKLATLLGLEIGDIFTVTQDEKKVTVTVTGICEQYIYHYVYMTDSYYQSLFGNTPETNMILLDYSAEQAGASERVSEALLELDKVTSIINVEDNRSILERQLKSVNACVVVIITAAAALAFVVLFNLSNINITERSRELATLRVLGFRDREMDSYVFRESIVLTILGMLAGLVMGRLLHSWLIQTVEIEIAMFGRVVKPASYVYSMILTLLFSLIANKLAGQKVRKIDMVESLKSVE